MTFYFDLKLQIDIGLAVDIDLMTLTELSHHKDLASQSYPDFDFEVALDLKTSMLIWTIMDCKIEVKLSCNQLLLIFYNILGL